MVKLVFLTEKFYETYSKCPEIEQKPYRPYIRIGVLLDGILWAVPMRSNINHENVIWTDKANSCGIDFSKAVAITNPDDYISNVKPYLRHAEFEALKTINPHTIEQKLRAYIKKYKKAKQHMDVRRNRNTVQFSTLQYFESYIQNL